MTPGTPRRTILVSLATAALVGGVAAGALATVKVYTNDFSSPSKVKEIKKAGGKKCKRKFKKQGSMRAVVESGPAACTFRPPVQGDGILPDHDFRVDGKVAKSIAKSVRKSAYLSVEARVGGDGVGYELRVFPHTGRFELIRTPGGPDFPVKGTDDAIAGIGKRNSLRLTVTGSQVRALVNRKQVAQVNDPDPGQVSGAKLRFALGNDGSSGKPVAGNFKKLTVAVPDP